ncbi:MAG TPA: hypothetical protein VGB67_10230 [Fibrella sp.]|jgi:hypothetical protein
MIWERELADTPISQFALGPTNVYVPMLIYYRNVLPLFVDLETPDEYGQPAIGLKKFSTLVKGHVIEGNQALTATSKRHYVKDSLLNRTRLIEWASLRKATDRVRWFRTHLITITFAPAWGLVLERLVDLQRRLTMTGWHVLFSDDAVLDLCPVLKIGSLVDKGLLPLTLVQETIRLATVRLYDFLRGRHLSAGQYNGRNILIAFNSRTIFLAVNKEVINVVYRQPGLRPGAAYLLFLKKPSRSTPK